MQLDPAFPLGPVGRWTLYYGDQGDGSSDVRNWWVVADMSELLPADIVTYGPNAITAQPPTRDWSPANWNCLSKNTLQAADGGLGFPATISVRPYWGLIQKKQTSA